jgi:predicted secreted hydrolase
LYKEITSRYTGRVWLDRNLGAKQVAVSSNDTGAYGKPTGQISLAPPSFQARALSEPSLSTFAPTISFKSQLYKEITSRYTGRVWLDRNLGAKQVAASGHDTDSYGSLCGSQQLGF